MPPLSKYILLYPVWCLLKWSYADALFSIKLIREVKAAAKTAAKKNAALAKANQPNNNANIPKIQKGSTFNARGGSKR